MVPTTLGLGHPGDYQTDRPCPQFVKGAGRLGGQGQANISRGHCGVAPAERSVGSLVWEEVQRGVQEGAHGPSIHHLKGAQPQGLSRQSPYSTIGESLVQSRCTSRVSLVRVL